MDMRAARRLDDTIGASDIAIVVRGAGSSSALTVDTELPTAAAAADGTANPTIPAAGAYGYVFNGATWDRVRGDTTGQDAHLVPRTSGGLLISRTLSAATTNATSVKASAGQVYLIQATNINAAVRYLKLYNKASAPTVGTDVPVLTLLLPASATIPTPLYIEAEQGIQFTTGIALALTTGIADGDSAAVAANEIIVSLFYK